MSLDSVSPLVNNSHMRPGEANSGETKHRKCVVQFVRQLLAKENTVIACVRNPDSAGELNKLEAGSPEKLSIMALDVSDLASVSAWASFVAEAHSKVDVLIQNAGAAFPSRSWN
jgi:NAD(P)-dependent dehydrogenase (short-subunit alcohol dehydrogenase family)